MNTPVRVLLVDDQDLFRAGLQMVLESDPDLSVVGQANDGIQAVALARELRPDVILMDIRMPRMDGIEATQRIVAEAKRNHREPPNILVLTTIETTDASENALGAGAGGFMLKNADPVFLIAAVKAMAQGKHVIATNELPGFTRAPEVPAAYRSLTEREREVFTALSHGLNNREIAQSLFLSEATVKTHLTSILQKLQLRDRVQAVVFAYTHGLAS